MPSTGFTLAGTGTNVDPGGTAAAWNNPGNITASDNTAAAADLGGKGSVLVTETLHATNFGFSLPTGAAVLGVQVRIRRKVDFGGPDTAEDHTVRLLIGGTASGDNNADLVTSWGSSFDNVDYGGSTNLWGLALTEAQVEAVDFGVSIRAASANVGSGALKPEVDAVWINIHYALQGANRGYILG